MKLKQLKANLTLVTDNQGREYLFSYETLVAGYDCDAHSDIEKWILVCFGKLFEHYD